MPVAAKPSKLNFVFASVAVLLMSSAAGARELNNVELFRRCYGQLTGKALTATDARIAQLTAGSLDPIAACEALLDKAKIDTNNADGKIVSRNDVEGLAVLRKLNQVFNTFIAQSSARENLSNFFEDFASTEDLQDFSAVGLVFTENALNPSRDFKDVFSISRVPVAVREIDSTVTYPFSMNYMYGGSYSTTAPVFSPRSRHGTQFGNSSAWVNPDTVPYSFLFNGIIDDQSFQTIQVGELVGINYSSPVQVPYVSTAGRTAFAGMPLAFDMNTTLFAGVPFLRTYVLANTNLPLNNQSRPTLEHMPRRLSRNILNDFLCRDLPAIRAADATPYISDAANALAFRKGSTCVRCHATMDQMAGVFRGVGYVGAGDFTSNSLHRYMLIAQKSNPVSGVVAETGWPALADNDYYKRPANGRFYYRNLSGQLVNVALSSGSSLTAQLAVEDDAYVCHAKKLFKYFTGINVTLNDIYDPDQAEQLSAMSAKDWEYRNLVIKLGKNLKRHQKVRQTIDEILKLNVYRQSDFGAGEL